MKQTVLKMLNLFFLIISVPVFAQELATDSLDAFIAKQVEEYHIPGLAVGVIRNNQVIFKKGYGITSKIDPIPVNTRTIFPIMSCTKAFTAAAMGMLVDQGKIEWKDKVIKHLPNFKLSDPWITKELTIADILSHRSGLESFDGDLLWYGTDYSREEIARRIRYSAIRKDFRTEFGYQNVMYLVAGLIIEKVTGHTWDDFLKGQIFSPMSMNSTTTTITDSVPGAEYARPHLTNNPIPLMNVDNIGPAGSINSNIDDMLKWVQLWIDKGDFKGKRIFSEDAFKTITTEKIKQSMSSDDGYGFGWNIGYEDGRKVLAHGGGMPGLKSFITIMPEQKTAIVILTNRLTYFNEELADVITDFVNSEQIDWKKTGSGLYGKNFRFSWDEVSADSGFKKHTKIPNFRVYKGLYEDKGYGKAMIREENGRAVLELVPSKQQFSGFLYYLGKNKFKVVFNDEFVPAGEVIFNLDKNQRPSGFKLNIDSGDFLFKYLDFRKL